MSELRVMRPRRPLLLVVLVAGLLPSTARAGIERFVREQPIEGQALQNQVYVLPNELHEAYGFWARVYSEWSSQQALIHLDRSYQIRSNALGQPLLFDTDSDFVRDYSNHALLAKARERGRPEYWRMQRGMSDLLLTATQTYWFFRDAMEAELRAEAVPVEALALGFLESLYTPDARSSAGAVGVFQLQPWEGRRHGARLGAAYNELLDPIASARLMARKLKADHALLTARLNEAGIVDRDSSLWPLVITGYNQGIQSIVDAALSQKKARYVELVFADRTGRFGFAGRNFYAQFRLFVDYLQRSRAALKRSNWPQLDGTVEISLGAFVDWPQLMQVCKLHPAWMQPINMGLTGLAWKGVLRVPPEVQVRFPVEVMPRFKRCLAGNARAALFQKQRDLARYCLRRGDNLSSVAAQLGTTPFALMQVNGISRDQATRLPVGRCIRVPTKRFADLADRVEQWAQSGRPRPASFVLYTVKKGQSVEGVERRFGLAHPELAKWNDLTRWQPGQAAAIPRYAN